MMLELMPNRHDGDDSSQIEGLAPAHELSDAAKTAAAASAVDGAYETTLCQLAPRQHGTVVQVRGESSLRNHLLELGFIRGTHVEFLRRAPLGDPIDVKLRGYRLSLREREACAVVVATSPQPKVTPKRFLSFRKAGK